jgi:serine/threonine protein kinase
MSQELAQQLNELKKLMDAGLITPEDYEHQKTEILRHLSQARFTSGSRSVIPELGSMRALGAYALLDTIGVGGMGTVYRGRHRNEEKSRQQGGDVAIKILHPQYAQQPAYQNRFEQEALLGLRMEHPNIVRVFDLIVDGEMLGLVMELIEGRELSDIIGRTVGPMPWVQAGTIFRQVLDAIACVHESGIVHRDIKPENLMVSGERVRLMDFGIAKDVSKNNTRTGTTMGTIAYMAPEQFLSARDVDERADVYALGMTLYEMLAGRLPWDDDLAEFGILKIKESGDYPGPEAFYPHIPQHVLDTLSAMLTVDIDNRITSVAAVRAALYPDVVHTEAEGLSKPTPDLDPTPVPAPVLAPSPGSSKPNSRGRRQLTAALTASGLGVGVLVLLCAGAPLVWYATKIRAAGKKLDESLVQLELFKTDAQRNQEPRLLEEARQLAQESLEIRSTAGALGVEALATVWLHEWHYPRTSWNKHEFDEDLALVRGALEVGESVEGRLAEALLLSSACRMGVAMCADGDAAYDLVLGEGARWLQLESAWTRAMFLNDRAAMHTQSGDADTARGLWSSVTSLCDRSDELREASWINSGELSRECAQARGGLADVDGWLLESRWLIDNLRDANGRIGSAITQRLWGTPAPSCVGIPWRWSPDFEQYIPKFRWSTQPELSFCYYAGLLALDCPHMASEVRALGRYEAQDMAWTEMMHAWNTTRADEPNQRCELDGLSLPAPVQGLFAERVSWVSSKGAMLELKEDGEYELSFPCSDDNLTLRGGWELRYDGEEDLFTLWASLFSVSGAGNYIQNPVSMFSQGDNDKLRFAFADGQLTFAGRSLTCGVYHSDSFTRTQ